MPELAIVVSPRQRGYLQDFAETLRYELELQALPSKLELNGFPEPQDGLVYALVAPHEYLTVEGGGALPDADSGALPDADSGALPDADTLKRTILVCAHPFEELEREGPAAWLRDAGAVFDVDPRSVALMRRAGIPATHLRPGYSKLRDVFDPEAQRPIDVVFLGVHTRHRNRQLGRCAPVLARHNCLLHVDDPAAPDSIVGDAKWELLRQTKVALNVHRGGDCYLEWLRVLDSIHAGAVVVSEQASGLAPLVPGEHLLVASPESLPFVLEAALRDGERLRRLRAAAHERIRSELPFASSVSALRAAAAELAEKPIAALSSGPNTRATPTEISPPHEPDAQPEGVAMRQAVREVSVGIVELRREMSRLEHLVRSGDTSPVAGREAETPAWSGRAPRVTAVITVCNTLDGVAATLESVAKSWYRDFELLVVDDGSTDGSSEVVRNWMELNPEVPASLLRHPIERGLGAARNTALEGARGSYCLILEAGDEIYPRCLEVLVGTLDGIDDAVFAYPMLDLAGNAEGYVAAGGDYVLNVFSWNPSRLIRSERVESLAMIRVEQLRELGGFAVELELLRWEDLDFWCRVAERGWRGQLVPQILGRRRARVADLRSNLTAAAPERALIARSPKLFTGRA